MNHNSINPEDANQRMIERGVRPLEPFTGAANRWKCVCMGCGGVVFPRYSTVVTAGKGGCNLCAKKTAGDTRSKRIRDTDFPKACTNANVTALSEFKNAFEKIDLRCNTCGYEFRMVWSPLRDGQGCPKCSREAQYRLGLAETEPKAAQYLLDANVRPVGPYEGMAKPYPGICLICGSEVKPRPSALQQGQGACLKCGNTESGRKRKDSAYTREEALAIMGTRQVSISPDEPYPGATKPWPGRCTLCGLPVATSVGNARRGKGGCLVCHSLESDSAFDFFGQGIIYLIASEKFRAYKLGIAGIKSSRLAAHRAAGWDKILFKHEAKGYEVNYVEQYVLSWLREEMGVEEAVSNDLLPEKGGTETWAFDTISAEVVWERVLEQFEEANWPVPLAIKQGTATKKARRTCTLVVDGEQCLLQYYSNNYCRKHYTAWKEYGNPLFVKRVPFSNTHCQVVEHGKVCNKLSQRSATASEVGMCMTHYHRNFEYGDPTFMKRPSPKPRLGVCSVQGCTKSDYSLGFCGTHYHADRRRKKRKEHGRSEPVKYESEICEVRSCNRKRASKGMCNLHYSRTTAYGSPELSGRGPRITSKVGHCRVDDCTKPDAQKGLCLNHYSREYKRKRRGAPSLLD